MFSLRLLSKITPTSTPETYIKFSDILLTLNPSSFNFIITFFLAYSNSSTFSSTVKYTLMLMYSLCDFCSLHLKRLFCKISISLKGSPILLFSWTRSMNGQKVALIWLLLQAKDMNSISFQLRTEEKVATQLGGLSNYIQNFSRFLELSDSLQTLVNLSWNSTIFFCSCSLISPSFLSKSIQALQMCLPHLMSSESENSSLSTSMISFSSRSLLSVSLSQNLISLLRVDSNSSSNPSISFLDCLVQSRQRSKTAFKAGISIFSIQVVNTFKFSTSPLFSSVSSKAARQKASQKKCSLGFLVRSSLAMDLQKEEYRESVSSKYLMKSLINCLVYSIFSLNSNCSALQMRVRSLRLAALTAMCCFSCSRLIFLRSEKAM